MKLIDSDWAELPGNGGIREASSGQLWNAYETVLMPNVLMHDVILGNDLIERSTTGARYTMKYQRPRPFSEAGAFLESQIVNVIVSAAETALPSSAGPDNLADLTVTPISRGTRTIKARVLRGNRPQH